MEPQETAERLRAVGFMFTVRELHRLAFVPLVSEESIHLLKKNLKPSPSCPREMDQSISLYSVCQSSQSLFQRKGIRQPSDREALTPEILHAFEFRHFS